MARPAQRWTQETRIHKGYTQLLTWTMTYIRYKEFVKFFLFTFVLLSALCLTESEEMTESRVRERERKTCCKGPQVGLSG